MTVSFDRAKEVRDEAVITSIPSAAEYYNIKQSTVKSYIILSKRMDSYNANFERMYIERNQARRERNAARIETSEINDKYNQLKAEFEAYKNRGLFARIINK